MKKTLLVLAILSLLFTQKTNAQTEKGNVMFGAALADLQLYFQEGNTTFVGNITPKAGFFIRDNVAIGPQVSLGLTTTQGTSSFTYGVGAFGRKYWGQQAENTTNVKGTKFFVEASAGINGVSGDGTSTTGLGVGIGPGLAYFITRSVALEGLFKYNLTVGFGNSTTVNNVGLNLGFQIYLPGRSTLNKVKSDVQ